MGQGGHVNCRLLLIITEPSIASRAFCWTKSSQKHPTWCSQLSKTKQNMKTVLTQLAIPINTHQNLIKSKVNRKCTCILGAVYTSSPAHLPDPPFQYFEGLILRPYIGSLCKFTPLVSMCSGALANTHILLWSGQQVMVHYGECIVSQEPLNELRPNSSFRIN